MTEAGDPIRLVPKAERVAANGKARMLRHLEHYRQAVESGEIEQLGIVVTYADGSASTSSVELDGKCVQLIGAVHVWLARITNGYLED